MERRVILKLIAAGVLANRVAAQRQHSLSSIEPAPGSYELQFFSRSQNEMIDHLSEIIIPADGHSPGAHEAKVSLYIDVIVSESGDRVKRRWRAGLKAVDEEAKGQFQKSFLDCSARQQERIVATMARNEDNPRNELERFFVRLKRMTIDGYYTSEVGIHQDLKYRGNTVLSEFPGCTHPTHKT